MITDWRYPNELEYLKKYKNHKITTIRLFRSDIPIPSTETISEHQLDDMSTDFILVPKTNSEEEFTKACELFPQYKKFTKQKYVCLGDSCMRQ